jgi:predicted helicase
VLLEAVLPDVDAVNEPGKIEFGAPDFALIKGSFPIGYVETKRLGENLDDIAKGEQLKRYYGYANLVLTNYLEFRFYKHGAQYGEAVTIADLRTLVPDAHSCTILETTIRAFLKDAAEPVRKASRLAEIMGENGKRLRANLLRFLKTESAKNKPLFDIYEAFKSQLIHDLSLEKFTDMYAQTLVYGLFVARYHDDTSKDFSRAEARDLIPHTNPLLRRFFDHIAGADFDTRLKPIVDELCEVFRNSDVRSLMQQLYMQVDLWGAEHAAPDPVIHFYEDFLKNYDSEQRKKLGAYYTPPAVVHFIVRSVDAILKRDFGLASGLADTKKITVSREVQGKKYKVELHQVQVLDPAAGTGTFLNETIRLIRRSFTGQEGRFSSYVEEDLLPRLHGFELMMAPYTIAHLKLAATLRESGAKDFKDRIGVYLTNSLEKTQTRQATLFSLGLAQSISEESQAAATIKNDTPIMVVIGNPPYSASSNNPSTAVGTDGKNRKTWIGELLDDYKKGLGERKINLDDDYVKFIRLAEHFIEKNGTGIVAMITNNSYIDGITHRQMRKHLLETFDEIYVLDLHGDSKEKTDKGKKDENVFAITQGVAVGIFSRRSKTKKTLGNVHHAESWGRRGEKFAALENMSLADTCWHKLGCQEPDYFFVPKDFAALEEYRNGFGMHELVREYSSGIQTKRDRVCISFTEGEQQKIVAAFLNLDVERIRTGTC